MSNRGLNSTKLAVLVLLGGTLLLVNPKCKCGCRTLAEHLIKAGFGVLAGPIA